MKPTFKLTSVLAVLIWFFGITQAQTTTACFEIESILVEACGNDEGNNEIVQFLVGPNALNTATMNVVWATTGNPWSVPCQNASTAQKVAALNATITACGSLLEPPGGILPPNSKVLLISGINFNPANISFAGLTDTYYVIFNCANPLFGNFANSGTGIRTLNITFPGCAEQVSYNRGLLSSGPGASIMYDFQGNATYTNNGCIPPITSLSAAWTQPAPLCQGDVQLDLNSLITGTPGGTWSGTGVTGNMFNPAGLTGQIAVLYRVGNASCAIEEEKFITVNIGGDASWTSPGTLCTNSPAVNLNTYITGTSGGTWSGTGVTGTFFNPASLNGPIAITYSIGTGACISMETNTITVSASTDPTWNFASPSVCSSSPIINLDALVTGTPGGIWSGTGVSGSNFSPAGLSGIFPVTYSVGSGACASNEQHDIEVIANPDASWDFLQSSICSSELPIDLNTLVTGLAGGSWSGNGVTGSLFNPAGLSGVVIVTYEIGQNPCIRQEAQSIVVQAAPSAAWNPPALVCSGSAPFNLVLLVTGTSGGTWSGTGVSGNMFNPSGLSGSIQLTYTVGTATCQEISIQGVPVIDGPGIPVISGDTEYCTESASALTVTGEAGAEMNWFNAPDLQSSIQTGSSFTPPGGQTATFYATQTSGGCRSAAASVTVTFYGSLAPPQANGNVKYCTGTPLPLLTATGNGVITWYSDPGLTNVLVIANQYQPNVSGSVSFYVTNTVGNCESAATVVLLSEEFPVAASISPPGPFVLCRQQPIVLASSSATGNLWSTQETGQQINANSAGNYILTVTGFCNTDKDTVVITDASVDAGFVATPLSGGTPLSVSFTNTSVNADSYTWVLNGNEFAVSTGVAQLFTEEGEYIVTLIARNTEGCIDSLTRTIIVFAGDIQFLMPNTFTPNEDGKNDIFKVASFGLVEMQGTIYNRWGEVLFNWDGVDKGWDGNYKGRLCQDGVYFYRIIAKDIFNKVHERIGSVLLLH